MFGPGSFKELTGLIRGFGYRALIITGAGSFRKSVHWGLLLSALKERGVSSRDVIVASEPTPEIVDDIVKSCGRDPLDIIVSIGGGSVIDTGKAVSAMLPLREPVIDYMDRVGNKKHPGVKIPFIAVPTTSGTGAEATKNASLRQVGSQGFKSSLRHDNFVPDVALVDPELVLNCPQNVTASCGMDALAQLLESFLSPRASILTDSLARNGLISLREGLLPAYLLGGSNLKARTEMAYAAFISGVTLANAGVGIVHSFASVIGGYFDIPHGVICGRLLPAGMAVNIRAMRKQADRYRPSLQKHAQAGALISGKDYGSDADACDELVRVVKDWVERLNMPRLSEYGISAPDFDRIIAETALRDNPVELSGEDMGSILEESI